jgi:hypothetical protein
VGAGSVIARAIASARRLITHDRGPVRARSPGPPRLCRLAGLGRASRPQVRADGSRGTLAARDDAFGGTGDQVSEQRPADRIDLVEHLPGQEIVVALLAMARRALPLMYLADTWQFAQTTRRDARTLAGVRAEGTNTRYAAIVALGAARLPVDEQRAMLSGATAVQLAEAVARRASTESDLGSAALAAWALAEAGGADEALLDRLVQVVDQDEPVATVDYAWTLTALLAATKFREFPAQIERAAARLCSAEGAAIFPHALPRDSLGRHRSHVGCYADQVYPIQALARHHAVTGERSSLDTADRCARQIVRLQGDAGQWWWHYDVRTGQVVEGYPVYSVHQHAMGPMALFDLYEAGGADHRQAITSGLSWLTSHPEVNEALLDEASGVIWRKVGRREPRKAVRSIRSLSTAVSPTLRIRPLDKLFPPTVVDYECRPYELGWLLYAWLAGGVVGIRP